MGELYGAQELPPGPCRGWLRRVLGDALCGLAWAKDEKPALSLACWVRPPGSISLPGPMREPPALQPGPGVTGTEDAPSSPACSEATV